MVDEITIEEPLVSAERKASGKKREQGSEGRVNAFWVIVRKEVSDHVRSWRFKILVVLLAMTCLGSLYTALSNIADAVKATDPDDSFLFAKLFTLTDGTLPSFTVFISFLGPLLGISLGFDAINSEQNRGTLSRLMAQPIHRDYLINAKFTAALIVISIDSDQRAFLRAVFSGHGVWSHPHRNSANRRRVLAYYFLYHRQHLLCGILAESLYFLLCAFSPACNGRTMRNFRLVILHDLLPDARWCDCQSLRPISCCPSAGSPPVPGAHPEHAPPDAKSAFQRCYHNPVDAFRSHIGTAHHGAGHRNPAESVIPCSKSVTGLPAGYRSRRCDNGLFRVVLCLVYEEGNQATIIRTPGIGCFEAVLGTQHLIYSFNIPIASINSYEHVTNRSLFLGKTGEDCK